MKIKQAANKFKKNLEESKKDEKAGIFHFLENIQFLEKYSFQFFEFFEFRAFLIFIFDKISIFIKNRLTNDH